MSESSLPNILTVNPNSRFQLLDRPVAAPGKCLICGAVDRPVVDTRWDVQFYGVIYFCVTCLAEVAGIIGMVDGGPVREAEANSAQVFERFVSDNDLKVIAGEQYRAWVSAVSSVHADLTSNSSIGSIPLDVQATFPEFNTVKDNGGVAKQESELAIDEGPISVPASSSDGNFFTF